MSIAIYPGSFWKFHEGHLDVLNKALKIFDKVIIAIGMNQAKSPPSMTLKKDNPLLEWVLTLPEYKDRIEVRDFYCLLVDYLESFEKNNIKISAVIRGLRNGSDLQYEMNMQYINEDLGLQIPVIYFITDRKLCHISSSILREIHKFREEK